MLAGNIKSPKKLIFPEARIDYYPGFFNKDESALYFELLKNKTLWQQDNITLFGKTYPQPRLTSLYGINSNPYTYSNITMTPHPFFKELLDIKKLIDVACKEKFTSCLLNFYRDGKDSNGWHADNEPELGENPIIASVSFGAERWFHIKHKSIKELKTKLLMENGSLLVMKGKMQHHWLHQVPKTKKQIEPRINLTFRIIK